MLTDQTYDNMTALLSLLKEHKPDPCYDTLPSTGEGLLPLKSYNLPQPIEVKDKNGKIVGKYIHFGLENALLGNSPGIYF